MTENKPEIAYLPPGVPATNHGHTVAAWVTMAGIMLGTLIAGVGLVLVSSSSAAGLVTLVVGLVVVAASLIAGVVLRNLGMGQKKVQR